MIFLYAYICTRETSVFSLIRRTFVSLLLVARRSLETMQPGSPGFQVVVTPNCRLIPLFILSTHRSASLYVHRDRTDYWGRWAQEAHFDFHTAPELWQRPVCREGLISGKNSSSNYEWKSDSLVTTRPWLCARKDRGINEAESSRKWKWEKWTSRQSAKHVKLHSDLPQASKKNLW